MKSRLLPILLTLSLVFVLGAPSLASPIENRVLRLWEQLDPKRLQLRSNAVLIGDAFGNTLYSKDQDTPRPIASVTKLMTAMVVLDSGLDLDERLTITKEDRDLIKLTGSRLSYGATLSRRELVHLALMASENRAAAALGRTHPGGMPAFVRAMNAKARELRMYDSHFADPAGLKEENIATPKDLVRMVKAASNYPLIREATTSKLHDVRPFKKRGPLRYVNTNRLVRNSRWHIQLSKTGYTNEAGRCLVMLAEVDGTELVMVFLDSFGKLTPFGDANRTLKWLRAGVEEKRTLLAVADASVETSKKN